MFFFRTLWIRYILLLIFSFIVAVSVAFGAQDQFNISVYITSDSAPPSVPASLLATAVSSSQINLSWATSTDNVGVIGYKVFRGLSQIGTTTHPNTNYSDTGLSASTMYSYTVSAYDVVPNESDRCATSSATTESSGGGGGTPNPSPVINNIEVVTATSTATITWTTDIVATSDLYWGETFAYELGVISDTNLETSHEVTINDLDPEMQYYYKISVMSEYGVVTILENQTFETEALAPPAPVISGLAVNAGTSTAVITWTTDMLATSTVYWGETSGYGLGTISGDVLKTDHEVLIESLDPVTQYHYKISVMSEYGMVNMVENQTFETEALPSDTFSPENVSNLQAVLNDDSNEIELSWENPPDEDFDSVRVMRLMTFYPSDPVDGMVIYEGNNISVADTDILTGEIYYYTVFAKDTSDNYSSGAVVSLEVPPSEETEEEDTDDDPPDEEDDTADDGGVFPPKPEDETTEEEDSDEEESGDDPSDSEEEKEPESISYVVIQNPKIQNLSSFNFTYIQDGKRQTFRDGGEILIDAGKEFTVLIDHEKVPEVLKTIIVVLTDPEDKNKKFSFLLRINKDKIAYEATIAPLIKSGTYGVNMMLYDYKDRKLNKISGVLTAYGSVVEKKIIIPAVHSVVTYTGVGIGIGQMIVLTTNVASFADIWLIVLRLLSSISGFFRRRRTEPWGVVYDSVTKRPLDPAYVTIEKEKKKNSNIITDIDGRYGFMVPPGRYVLDARKTHYKFPSKRLAGKTKDEFYEDLYFGDTIEVGVDTSGLVHKNIPLDPIGFDWNEYAKQQQHLFVVHSRKKRIISFFANIIFFGGFGFSIYALWLDPGMLNYGISILYTGIFLIQSMWRVKHKMTRLIDDSTGLPIPFAIIKAYIDEMDILAKKVVSDESGNFYLLTPPGTYYFTIEKKLPDETYSKPYRTKSVNLKKGVILKNVYIKSK